MSYPIVAAAVATQHQRDLEVAAHRRHLVALVNCCRQSRVGRTLGRLRAIRVLPRNVGLLHLRARQE